MRRMWSAVLGAAAITAATVYAQGPANSPARIVDQAAEALGGKARIQALKSLTIVGYGQIGLQNGGGNMDPSPHAPQRIANATALVKTIDLEHSRLRTVQTQSQNFTFAYERNMRGIRSDQRLDGDVAFNVDAAGKATRAGAAAVRGRRLDMLNNPVAIVRAALDPAAKLGKLRTDKGTQILELTSAAGDSVEVAFNATTHLPEWLSWVQADANLGEVTVRTYYSAYQQEKGVQVPWGYLSVIDFRDSVVQRTFVDRVRIDEPIDDLAAPADVRSAQAPVPPRLNIEAVSVAKGIWYLKGQGNSTAFEFADHITLFETYASEANALAIIEKARTLVPGKPVTDVIVSHHHFDHSGGLRAVASQGLTVITHRANVDIFKEMVARPARFFPDALGRSPKPLKITPVDDKLVLKDSSMEVVVYRVMNNAHMSNAVLAYAPSARTVSQGDLIDENWDLNFWANSYPDTVKYWKLDVDRDLAVHGNINPYPKVLEMLHRQANNEKALCDRVAAAGFSMPGCPAANVDF